MPTDEIRYAFEQIGLFLQKAIAGIDKLWGSIPSPARTAIVIVSIVAGINIVAAIVKAIIINRASWK